MFKTNRIALLGLAVAAVATFAAPRSSEATITISLAPTAGENLSTLQVGQEFQLDVIYQSDNAQEVVERHFGKPEGSFANLSLLSFTENPALTSSYLTTPVVGEVATFQANAAGSGTIFADFMYNDQYNVLGYIETNEKSSYFLDTNTLAYTVGAATAVPEPASVGALGMAGVGLLARRRRRSATTA